MLKFYWSLGADIVRMEPDQPWGSKFMQHLGEDIRREIPNAGCFSCGNLYYMRWFFELYCMRPILPQLGGELKGGKEQLEPIVPQAGEQLPVEAYQLRFPNVAKMLLSVPWGHHKVIIDKFKGRQNDALFYVRKIVENAPVRVKNMLNNIGVRTLWELVHFDMAKYRACRGGFFASGRIFQNGVGDFIRPFQLFARVICVCRDNIQNRTLS